MCQIPTLFAASGVIARVGKWPRSEMEIRMQSLSETTWKLIGASAIDEGGRDLSSPLGPHPMGFAVFEAERMIVAVGDGRLSLPPDAPNGFSSLTPADIASMEPNLLQPSTAHQALI
jgi:hypothetical protein